MIMCGPEIKKFRERACGETLITVSAGKDSKNSNEEDFANYLIKLDLQKLNFTTTPCTLTILLDKFASARPTRLKSRTSAPLYDADCRQCKVLTRKLEKAYRRKPSDQSRSTWRTQFYRSWSVTIDSCGGDPRGHCGQSYEHCCNPTRITSHAILRRRSTTFAHQLPLRRHPTSATLSRAAV